MTMFECIFFILYFVAMITCVVLHKENKRIDEPTYYLACLIPIMNIILACLEIKLTIFDYGKENKKDRRSQQKG